jgi:hypothetical protein
MKYSNLVEDVYEALTFGRISQAEARKRLLNLGLTLSQTRKLSSEAIEEQRIAKGK